MRLTIAWMLLGLACVDSQGALSQYCVNHRDECSCAEAGCCLSPGTRCEDGQPCCAGTCSGGLCPGMRLDAGLGAPPPDGGSTDAG